MMIRRFVRLINYSSLCSPIDPRNLQQLLTTRKINSEEVEVSLAIVSLKWLVTHWQ